MSKKSQSTGSFKKPTALAAPRPGFNQFGSHKENPTEGFPNPFFRGEEKRFSTEKSGDIDSPVNSVFGVPLRHDSSNVMEDELKGLSHAGRGDTFGNQKSGKKGRNK